MLSLRVQYACGVARCERAEAQFGCDPAHRVIPGMGDSGMGESGQSVIHCTGVMQIGFGQIGWALVDRRDCGRYAGGN